MRSRTAIGSRFVVLLAMMLPIALSVTRLLADKTPDDRASNFPLCLMLGIAYSASIGGVATLIGTPPNLVFASMAEGLLGGQIDFVAD